MNDHALHILNRGVESLGIKLGKDVKAADLAVVLKGVDLAKVEVNIVCCPVAQPKLPLNL